MRYKNAQSDKRGNVIFRYGSQIGETEKSEELISEGIEVYDADFQNLPKLNKNNSDIVENRINTDPGYSPNFMEIVFYHYYENGEFVKSDESIRAMMKIIDIVNGTQLFIKRRKHFDSLFNYINGEQNLLDDIKNGNVDCVKKIISNSKGNELSFVSKFCKFMNKFMNSNQGDAFFIYDYYVKEAVNYYLDYYNFDYKFNRTTRDYDSYFEALSKIQEASKEEFGEALSKDYIDHIIWYYFKSFSQGSAARERETDESLN